MMAERAELPENTVLFILSEEEYTEFERVLDMLPEGNKLKELARRKSVFEDESVFTEKQIRDNIDDFRYAIDEAPDEATRKTAQARLEHWLDIAESQGIQL